ncbi:MAG: beta-galactosidase trimerization domain-containing protein [Candidatus Sumerlaeota bacterium]|nr:beta-galactosidase trimerization domain-containing protein [Candidatus Sumerlaeota bacterium]
MSHEPLPHHLRIAALQCNFEGGQKKTLSIPRLWQEFGFGVEQLFHTHSELYTAVFDKDVHGDLLAEYLAEAARNGISIIVYLNCHILAASQRGKIAEWAQVDYQGAYRMLYETYYACCLNSSWSDRFLTSIESLKGYDIAGIFLDGPNSRPCYCPRCRERFFSTRGIALEAATPEQAVDFGLDTAIEFMKSAYATAKKINPRWLTYSNAHLMNAASSASQMKKILSHNDIVGTEGGFQFYGPPKDVDVWRCGVHARMVEAVAQGKRKVIFMAGDHKPWSWHLHTPAETKLCYASILANGCSAWYGIHCNTESLRGVSGNAVHEMIAFDKNHAALYEHTRSLAEVALLYSFNTAKYYKTSEAAADFYATGSNAAAKGVGNYADAVQGACGVLFRSGIPWDVITELNIEDLDRYAVLVIPTGACLEESAAEAIRAYVRDGGVIVADSETSLYDGGGDKRDDFILADVIGASVRGYRRYKTHDYFCLEERYDVFAEEGARYLPAPTIALEVEPAETAEVMGRLCPPLAGRYAGRPEAPASPFIIKNRMGDGVSYYFAGAFFELYRRFGIVHCRRLIQSIIDEHSAPRVRLRNAPESVEITVRESLSARAVLVHLVNYTGSMSRPIERVTPLHGLSLEVSSPIASAKALVSGKTLAVGEQGVISLPEIKEYEVIVLE